jgi:hypothetical protein
MFALPGLAVALALSGCAGNTITDSRGQATGLKYYSPRPAILPVGKVKSGSEFPAELVSIPDTRRPQFVELGSGFGGSGFELTMASGDTYVGYATKFEQLATTQNVPKAITSVTNGAATIIGAVAIKNAVEK